MQLGSQLGELTYCTNIHRGETWHEVQSQLAAALPVVKQAICPDAPFGVGLRLSAEAASELAQPVHLNEFQGFLERERLYVFTINGFPYGTFHGTPVKAQVYAPDWRTEARLTYTNQLAELLAVLLPDDRRCGTISTVPGGFKPDIQTPGDIENLRDTLIRHAAFLYRLEESQGRCIALALEPEPHCFLETIAETVDFFQRWLFDDRSIAQFASLTGASRGWSASLLRRHLGVCLDTCHAAVEFESPGEVLRALAEAEVDVKKMQLSAGIRIPQVKPEHLAQLQAYCDPVYLHQVVAKTSAGLVRYLDLDQAIDAYRTALGQGAAPQEEWRIHFHVPIFLEQLEPFENTRGFLVELLRAQRLRPFTEHLEVETYTWEVLPKSLQTAQVTESLVRELRWAQEVLCRP